MKPRGENIEYDKLRDKYDALIAELATLKAEQSELLIEHARRGLRQEARISKLEALARAAVNALRSYQYGNSATDLAEEVADLVDAGLPHSRGDGEP